LGGPGGTRGPPRKGEKCRLGSFDPTLVRETDRLHIYNGFWRPGPSHPLKMQRFEPPPDPRDIRHFRGAEPANLGRGHGDCICARDSERRVRITCKYAGVSVGDRYRFSNRFFFESSILKRFHGTL